MQSIENSLNVLKGLFSFTHYLSAILIIFGNIFLPAFAQEALSAGELKNTRMERFRERVRTCHSEKLGNSCNH